MSFIWPVVGPITRNFYYKSSLYVGGQHAAIDIGAAQGIPIKASESGTVIANGWDMYSGFFVGLDHGLWQTFYRHMYQQPSLAVGKSIAQGQAIGYVGSTGVSLGPHLHFDLWSTVPIEGAFPKRDIWAVDPELHLVQEDDMDEATIRQIIAEMIATSDLPTVQGQVNQLIEMHKDEGNEHHAWLLNIQGQVNQNIEMHRGPHGQTAGGQTAEDLADQLTGTVVFGVK